MPKLRNGKSGWRYPALMWVFVILTMLTVLTYSHWITFFYPVHYRETVIKYSQEYEIDPLLVFALIKVESHFNSEAKSASGARGLMQLMPDTAHWAAEQLDIEGLEDHQLNEPTINLLLGCWYLSDLMREFDGQVPLVLAAYNAGRGNVREWLTKGYWDGSEGQLSKIPFPETRSHVKKVQDEYQIYQTIYRDTDFEEAE